MKTVVQRQEVNNDGEIEIHGINFETGEPVILRAIEYAEGGVYHRITNNPVLRIIPLYLIANCNLVTTNNDGNEQEIFQLILENRQNENWIVLSEDELNQFFEPA